MHNQRSKSEGVLRRAVSGPLANMVAALAILSAGYGGCKAVSYTINKINEGSVQRLYDQAEEVQVGFSKGHREEARSDYEALKHSMQMLTNDLPKKLADRVSKDLSDFGQVIGHPTSWSEEGRKQ